MASIERVDENKDIPSLVLSPNFLGMESLPTSLPWQSCQWMSIQVALQQGHWVLYTIPTVLGGDFEEA